METRAQWAARAASCVWAINAEYNVAGLCAEFPERLQACMDEGGERLAKRQEPGVVPANVDA